MAEAAVEDRSLRFFCHVCNLELHSVSSEYTCPLCCGGFIEELPVMTASTSTEHSSPNDIEMDDLDFLATLTSFLSRDGGRPPDVNPEHDNTQGFLSNTGRSSSVDGSNSSANGLVANSNSLGTGSWTRHGRSGINNDITSGSNRRARRGRLPNFDRFDNVLLEILHTLSGGNDGSLGNASMFFMGNPGDYAWGREGIDTIVTQLLNQMDTAGPPPLSKEKIDEIPNVEITKEQVNIKLQCSVCWEDFKLQETVRKLPCLHFYHEPCIIPWLELHGTCPICRKSLAHEVKDAAPNIRATSASLFSGRELSVDNNSRESLSSIQSGNENNSSNTNSNTGNTRRLHISLPRFTLFGQADANRSAANTLNYDLAINSQGHNSNNSGGNYGQPTTANAVQRQTTTSSLPNMVEQNINKSDNLSASKNNDQKSSNNSTNNNFNNLPKSMATHSNLQTNEGDELNAGSTSSAVESTTVNNDPQTDVFKFDDGQVDYEFD